MVELSLLVVNYHSGEPLRRLLDSLRAHPPAARHELLVADNAGDDGVAEWLAREHPEVVVVPMAGNRGYAHGVNALIARASGEALLVLNPDVELGEGGLDRCLRYLRNHPEVGLCSGELLNADGSPQHNGRRFYDLTTILLRRTPLSRLRPEHPALARHLMLDRPAGSTGPVDWVMGAFMLARREAVEDVGPMDDRFFLYFEDVDWCQRMWDAGWEVHLVGGATFTHEHQRTSARVGRTMWHHLRSFLGFADKWGGLAWVARHLRGGMATVAAVTSDLLALNLAFLLAFLTRRLLDPLFPYPLYDLVDYLPLILFTNLVSLVALPLLGRYRDPVPERRVSRWIASLRAAFVVVLVTMAGTWLSHSETFSRAVLLLFVPWYLVALEGFALLGRRLLAGVRSGAPRRARVLLLGPGVSCSRLAAQLGQRPGGDVVAGAVSTDGAPVEGVRELSTAAPDLRSLARGYHIDRVLVDAWGEPSPQLVAEARRLAASGVELLVDQPWMALAGGDHSTHRYGRRWWRAAAPPALRRAGWVRPLVDRPAGLLLTLLALPGCVLCLALAWPLRLVSPRTTPRRGRGGRVLRWPEWVARGSGVPWPGLVQLPRHAQLLLGRLSVAGPLPLPATSPEEIRPVELLRTELAPGLTGPWAGAEAIDPAHLAHVERDYIDHWSLTLDLDHFLRGLPRLLLGRRPWPAITRAQTEGDDG